MWPSLQSTIKNTDALAPGAFPQMWPSLQSTIKNTDALAPGAFPQS
jgi:hypothetical protein